MRILECIKKFPGGLVVVPLLITALINTLFPQALDIGGVTTALFKQGMFTIIGLLLFFSGCQLKLSQLGTAIRRGGIIILVKILVAFLTGILLMNCFGPEGFWGISTLALVSAISSNNPAVYLAVCEKYGDETDGCVFGLLCLISMPMLPLAILGLSGGSFDYREVLTLVIPFALGFLLGNLDPQIAQLMRSGTTILLPFMGFCFGSCVNLVDALRATGSGLLLLLIYTATAMLPQVLANRLLVKQTGYAALASCTLGGTALVIPALAANAMPVHAPNVDAAVAQLAFAMTFSCLLTPFLTKLWMRQKGLPPGSEG